MEGGLSATSTRGEQMRQGMLNKWRGRYGMTDEEIYDAQALAQAIKVPMDAACRQVVRWANRASVPQERETA